MKEIAALYLQAADSRRPMTGPVRLHITAVFAIPASWPARLRDAALAGRLYFTGKPDRDNIEKLVCDSLKELAWVDDSQVCAGPVVKRYGTPARTDVAIEEISQPAIPATPGEERRTQWVDAGMPPRPRRARPANSTKAKTKKLPAALQRAVDRAFAKERRG